MKPSVVVGVRAGMPDVHHFHYGAQPNAIVIRQRYHADSSPWPAAFKKEMEFEHAFAQAGGLLLAGLDPTGMGGVTRASAISVKLSCWLKRDSHRWRPSTLRPQMARSSWENSTGSAPSLLESGRI